MASKGGNSDNTSIYQLVNIMCQNLPLNKEFHKLVVALVSSDRQGSVPRGGHRRGINICPLVQQHSTHLHVASAGCLHQGGEASLQHIGHRDEGLSNKEKLRCVILRQMNDVTLKRVEI